MDITKLSKLEKDQQKNLKYAVKKLAKFLGKPVKTPFGKKMLLVELYSNGNIACIPLKSKKSYFDSLQEFHALSVKGLKGK